ncbi:MAG: glycoside hydrolase family 3 C-terminal domain-containing protein [Bryobacterales bacterium]|nr:glycoside hydrolase family 3 C-terminal domain-containing protein [Bryobacteraceae bacterium]MDW8354296.1 glycoside hydrolase family 3 C-terminal domain-containing protein [Bryobacterales bacterium]
MAERVLTRGVTLAALLGWAVTAGGQNVPVWQNPDAPLEQRVEDLLSRMTLEEKVSQMMSDAPAIPRLGVPAYNWWNECLHGVARAGRATVFPQVIGLAATWDADLIFRVATAISDEARAKHHEFVRRGKRDIYQGLTFWTPNINLFRDPRWGRGMETWGEDPYLTSRLAGQFIRGLQGDDPRYLKTVATAKHYAVHSGPEPLRHSFDARPSEEDLWQSYLPHFEASVRRYGAVSVMCAYNRVLGDPACASPRLLGDILRKQWGFAGYVVSDCGAIEDIYKWHKVASTAEEAAARAVKAGCDLNCGVEYRALVAAVRRGLLTESEIDTAVRRLLTARFRLGMFDPPERVPYARIPYSVVDSPAHRALALEAARKSIVLLKNDGGLLPLRRDIKAIAVIGPNADDVDALLGNYHGDPSEPITPLAGIRAKVSANTRVLYARGSDLAEGLPHFETVPASALFTSDQPDRQPGLLGEYFNTAGFNGRRYRPAELTHPRSGQMAGTAAENPRPVFTRVDREIAFRWWDGAPRADMNDDDFGVRWTGFLAPPVSGRYQLGGIGQNAAEIYLDGKPIVRFHDIHERRYAYATVDLEAGKLYPLRIEFHHVVNDADFRLVWAPPRPDLEKEALEVARKADVIVAVLGLSPRLEGEEMAVPVAGFRGGDRLDLSLPAVQEHLLRQLAGLGKPVVLVLLNGSALAVNWALEHVPAVVEAWYPGQAGGLAIADVLFGDYNPAGRLPVTFYRGIEQLPAFDDYRMAGRTYRYFEGEPLLPFGFGLSYTRFAYSRPVVPAQAETGSEISVAVEVTNTGPRDGDEVVQLYVEPLERRPEQPRRWLAGFERLHLRAGETRRVQFRLEPRQLAVFESGRWLVRPGKLRISVGGKQPGFRGRADAPTTGVVTVELQLTGKPKVL